MLAHRVRHALTGINRTRGYGSRECEVMPSKDFNGVPATVTRKAAW